MTFIENVLPNPENRTEITLRKIEENLSDLKICFFNSRSIRNKQCELRFQLENDLSEYDVIGISESWLNSEDILSLSDLGYEIIRKDRSNDSGHGGGVLFLVKSKLSYEEINLPQTNVVDCVALDILGTSNKKLRLSCIYCPPWNEDNRLNEMKLIFGITCKSSLPCLLFGDFNVPHIKWDSLRVGSKLKLERTFLHEFIDLCIGNNLQQLIFEPTHKLGNTLDLLFCNEPYLLSDINVNDYFCNSDHMMISFCASCSLIGQNSVNIGPKFNFRKADSEGIKFFLDTIHWDEIFSTCSDVEQFYQQFLDTMNFVFENFVPKHSTNSFSRKSLWSKRTIMKHGDTRYLYRSIKRLEAQLKDNKNVVDQLSEACVKYKVAKNELRTLIRSDDLRREQKILQSKNQSVFYKFVNSKLHVKPRIPVLRSNNEIFVTDKDKSNCFNKFFESVFTVDNGTVPQLPNSENDLCDIHFNEFSVLHALSSINTNASMGPDSIPSLVLNNYRDQLCQPLSTIFNVSFQQSRVPDLWSVAHVVPIFKGKGEKSNCKNYRPVSLTSSVCKVMETIIKNEIFDHVGRFGLLTRHQHGFRSKFSTISQLLECLNDWTSVLDNNKQTDVAYLDFAKAFDSVSHPKLLSKLRSLGISGLLLQWIESFLENRTQRVRTGSQLSDAANVTSGVPQGTVLGPVLFLLYVNDLTTVVKDSSIKLYADDVKLYVTADLRSDQLKDDLRNVSEWAKLWQLNLSFEKCKVLNVSRHPTRNMYELDNNPLENVSSITDLGIMIDSSLKPHLHVHQVVCRAKKTSACIFKSFRSRNHKFLIDMFKVYVRPLLEYASVCWNPGYVTDIDAIERVQKSFICRFYGLQEGLSYAQKLKMFGLDSLELRRTHNDLTEVYKIFHGLSPLRREEFFSLTNHQHSTRGHVLKIKLEKFTHNERKYFFTNRVIPVWNSLSDYEVLAPSVETFKNRLKKVNLSQFLKCNLL